MRTWHCGMAQDLRIEEAPYLDKIVYVEAIAPNYCRNHYYFPDPGIVNHKSHKCSYEDVYKVVEFGDEEVWLEKVDLC